MKNIAGVAYTLFIYCSLLIFSSCSNEDVTVKVKTYPANNVTSVSCTIKGSYTIESGDPDFIETGICYSSSVTYPKITNSRYIVSKGDISDFEISLSGLSPDSVYKYRTYAMNADTVYYGTTYSFRLVDISNEVVFVKGGTFTMGATSEQSAYATDQEKPAHSVTLSDFYIGKYEVSNEQFALFLNSRLINSGGTGVSTDGSSYKFMYTSPKGLYYDNDSAKWLVPVAYRGCPVVNVTWYGASEYCLWAGGKLPTEAQWEYAARGGNSSKGFTYSGSNDVSEVGWYKPDLYDINNLEYYTQVSGKKKANEIGIFDMSGNVWEWCNDWYTGYKSTAQTNPTGPTDDEAEVEDSEITNKVRRGGGWADASAVNLRVSNRASNLPGANAGSLGFRFAK